MSLIAGVDVRLLQDDTNGRGLLGVSAGQLAVLVVVPVVVLLRILKNTRRQRMPNAKIRKKNLRVQSLRLQMQCAKLPLVQSTQPVEEVLWQMEELKCSRIMKVPLKKHACSMVLLDVRTDRLARKRKKLQFSSFH